MVNLKFLRFLEQSFSNAHFHFLAFCVFISLFGSAQIEIVQQTNHSAVITSIAVSADGRYTATSEYYVPRIFIWDNYSRKKVVEIQTIKDVLDLAFSPDGKWLYAVTIHNSIYRYHTDGTLDAEYHKKENAGGLAVIYQHSTIAVTDKWVAYPASSTQLKGGFENMSEIQFNMGYNFIGIENSRGKLTQLASSTEANAESRSDILSIHISSNNERLIGIRENGNIEVWDLAKKKLLHNAPKIEKLGFGKGIHSSFENASNSLYFLTDGKPQLFKFSCTTFSLDSISLPEADYSALVLDEQKSIICLGDNKGGLLFYDLKNKSTNHISVTSKGKITDITLLPGNKSEYLITSGIDMFVVNEAYKIAIPYQEQQSLHSPFDLSISSNNVLIAAQDSSVYFVNLGLGTNEQTLTFSDFVYFCKLSPNDSLLVVVTKDSLFGIDFLERTIRYRHKHENGRPREVNFSNNSTYFCLAHSKGATIHTTANGKIIRNFDAQNPQLKDAIRYLVGGDVDDFGNLVFINSHSTTSYVGILPIDSVNPTYFYTYNSHGPIRVFALSPDSKRLSFAYPEGWKSVKLNLDEPGFYPLELNKNTSEAAFSNDSKLLATGGLTGKVFVYDARSGRTKMEFDAGNARVFNLLFSKNNEYLFTNMQDGYILVYNLLSEKAVGKIFMNKGELLFVSEDGYYSGSRKMISALGLKKDNAIFSFYEYDAILNKPSKVFKQFGFSSDELIKQYELIENKRNQYLQQANEQPFTKNSTLLCFITNRAEIPQFTANNTLELQISTNTQNAPLTYHVWVNGVPIFGLKGLRDTIVEQLNVQLLQGLNTIEIAVERNGSTSERTILKVYKTTTDSINVHYIGIGVSHYQNEKFNLNYAAKDVKDLADALSTKHSTLTTHLFLDENATKSNLPKIKEALQKTKPEDIILMSLSGHGILDDSLSFYFASYDMNFDDPKVTGISYQDLENLLDAIPARRKLLLIDACHSGELDNLGTKVLKDSSTLQIVNNVTTVSKGVEVISTSNEKSLQSFKLMQELFANINSNNGAFVISAAAGEEYAYEFGSIKNGVFTHSILNQLNTYQSISVSELRKQVSNEVQLLTNGAQKPTSRQENLLYDWFIW